MALYSADIIIAIFISADKTNKQTNKKVHEPTKKVRTIIVVTFW